jgi:hypothetical protein
MAILTNHQTNTLGKNDDTDLLTFTSGELDVAGTVDATNFKINGAQGSDGQVLTSTGSGVAWEDASGGGGGSSVGGSSGVDFNDNVKARFGTGNDLEIYHSGSASIIDDVGNGPLQIKGSTSINFFASNGEYYGYMVENGAFGIYYDGSQKLATTSSGIDVTGTVELDNITVSGAQGSDGQVLTSTGSGIAWEDASGGGGGGFTSITRAGKTADYTIVAGDAGKVIEHTDNDITLTFTAAATLGDGFHVWVKNLAGTGDVTSFDFNGSENMEGRDTDKLYCGESFHIYCDGSNFKILDDDRGISTNIGDDYYARPDASGDKAVAAGSQTTASGDASLSMGYSATASGSYSLALGYGAYASGTRSFAAGWARTGGTDATSINIGTSSTSYGATNSQSIAIGYYCKSSGQYATAIGRENNVSGGNGAIGIGYNNSISGSGGTGIGYDNSASYNYSYAFGNDNSANANYSVCLGARTRTRTKGEISFGSGTLNSAGYVQANIQMLQCGTTDATQTTMTSSTHYASSDTVSNDNVFLIPQHMGKTFTGMVIAKGTTASEKVRGWKFEGVAFRGTNASSTELLGSSVTDLYNKNASSWAVALAVNTTRGSVDVKVTGEASTDIHWSCRIDSVQIYHQS